MLNVVSSHLGVDCCRLDRPAERRRGILLIEVLVSIAVIAMLIGLLLPAIQSARVEASKHSGFNNLQQLRVGMDSYMADRGRFPRGISQSTSPVLGFWDHVAEDNPQLRFGPNGDTFIADGYEFFYDHRKKFYTFTAIPLAPGLTGDDSLLLTGSLGSADSPGKVRIEAFPTPGADENRERAFANIRRCALESIADLLLEKAEPGDERIVKQFISDDDSVKEAFTKIDKDGDGKIAPREFADAPVPRSLAKCIASELRFSDGQSLEAIVENEEEGIRFPTLDDLGNDPTVIPSFESVIELTSSYTSKPGIAKSLVKKLQAAERAEFQGATKTRDNILGAYQNAVDAQAGKALEPIDAATLTVLAEVLKAAAPAH
jgi:type II secretory pathway pseudopilin PulG